MFVLPELETTVDALFVKLGKFCDWLLFLLLFLLLVCVCPVMNDSATETTASFARDANCIHVFIKLLQPAVV